MTSTPTKRPSPGVVSNRQAKLREVTREKKEAEAAAEAADRKFRAAIKSAFKAGLTAPQIADPTEVSEQRTYQIRDGVRQQSRTKK